MEFTEDAPEVQQVQPVEKVQDKQDPAEDAEVDKQLASEEPLEKSMEGAAKAKEEGNSLFRDKDYTSAALAYTRAIELCPLDEASAESMVISSRSTRTYWLYLTYFIACRLHFWVTERLATRRWGSWNSQLRTARNLSSVNLTISRC